MPLAKLWEAADLDVAVCDDMTVDFANKVRDAQVIVTDTEVSGLITVRWYSLERSLLMLGLLVRTRGWLVMWLKMFVTEQTSLSLRLGAVLVLQWHRFT